MESETRLCYWDLTIERYPLDMGKGLDTCLVVKPLILPRVEAVDVDIAQRKKKLLQLTTLNITPQLSGSLARQVS